MTEDDTNADKAKQEGIQNMLKERELFNQQQILEQKKYVQELTTQCQQDKINQFVVKQEELIEKHSGIILKSRDNSYTQLQEQLDIMKYIPFESYKHIIFNDKLKQPFFIVGVIIKLSEILKTKKNESYMRISISDLQYSKSDFFCKDSFHRSIRIMLFGSSYKKIMNESLGCVVVIFSPRSLGSEFGPTLSIDADTKIHPIGISKDFGICSSINFLTSTQCKQCVNLSYEKMCQQHQSEVIAQIKSSRPGIRSDIIQRKPYSAQYNEEEKKPSSPEPEKDELTQRRNEAKKDLDQNKLRFYFEKRKHGKFDECIEEGEVSSINFKELLNEKAKAQKRLKLQ